MRIRPKTLDLLVVGLLVVLAGVLTIAANLNFLVSTLAFFGVPSLYLVARNPAHFKKALLAATIFGLIWGFSFNFIAELNDAWDWTPSSGSVIPFNLLGEVSGDVLVWYFLWVFLAIIFYEHFIDRVTRRVSKRATICALVGIGVGVALTLIHLTAPQLLIFPYTYLWLGGLACVPFVYIILKDPKLLSKALLMIPFFAIMYLVCELASLHQGLWSFPGQYIGTVALAGLSFPIEEFFFWIISSSAIAVTYYEYLIDDEK